MVHTESSKFMKGRSFNDVWKRDEIKKNKFESNGFMYLTLWEEDDINNNLAGVRDKIIYAINN